jgi:hypothetical protein
MTQTQDANAILMGGGGARAAKFDTPNDRWAGRIVSPPQAKQERDYDPKNPGGGDLKFFPSGDPIMGVTVDIQTTVRDPSVNDDDGIRKIYIEGRYIKEAVREAVRAAGASGLEVGGELDITFTHREDPMDKRSRKFWTVKYTPAGNAALMDTQQTGAPQSAPVTVSQPAPVAAVPAPAPAAPVPAAPPGLTPEQMQAVLNYQAAQAAAQAG